MGQGQILQDQRHPKLDIFRNRKKEDGTSRELVLLSEANTPIQRHIKIKAEANPHDPQWDQYFVSAPSTPFLLFSSNCRIL
ncbi:MAG: hypothetical protein ACOH2K_11215, partial [Burkholderiaceae bacterium]